MGKYKKDIKTRTSFLLICEVAIIICVHLLYIDKLYGFFLSEDELGYWGNAAFFLGKDWGNTVSSCGYYSYGYSFFLMLIMSLPVSALTMYRMAIAANALFMVASFLISYYLFTRLFPKMSKALVSIACMAMALYSSYIAQSSVAWSECYLVLFTWLVLLQSYLICKKANTIRILIFAVELGYLYMIHQRTVPFLIAGIILIVLLTSRKKVKIRQLIIMVSALAVMICIAIILKGYLKSEIYSSGRIANDYSSIAKGMKLSNLIIPVIRAAAGQIYYLWAASFGIIPLGIGATVAACIKKWKEKNEICYFYGFVLLVFLGVLGVSSIFVRLGVKRIDYLIYGRYIENMAGYFIIVGFLAAADFVKGKRSWIVFGISSAGFLGLALLLLNKIQSWNIPLVDYQGVCAAGTFWFYSLKEFSVLHLCVIILLVEVCVFALAKLLYNKSWIVTAEIFFFIFFWIWAGTTVIRQQICTYQDANNRDLTAKNDLWEYIEGHADSAVLLTNTRFNTRGSLQLYLGKIPLFVISDMEEIDYLPDILIVDSDDSVVDNDKIEKYYFAGYVGRKSIYSLNEIPLDNLDELTMGMFSYHPMGTDEEGYAMFGPYIHLKPGTYEVTFQMNVDTNGQDVLGIMDVACDGGNTICSSEWNGSSQFVTLRFHLEESTGNIEFRYFKNAGNDTIPLKVTLNFIHD